MTKIQTADLRSKAHKTYPSQDRLRGLFNYDTDTGEFLRRFDIICGRGRGHVKFAAGTRAGAQTSHGYRVISVDGKTYFEHVLAWIYTVSGDRPEYIDHIDGNGSNNRIANLRPCTKSQNQANAGRHVDNASGYKGVTWSNHARKWRATIGYEKRVIHLGYFDSPDDAHSAYVAKSKELFGDFARAA